MKTFIIIAGIAYLAAAAYGMYSLQASRAYSVTFPLPSKLRWAVKNIPLALIFPITLAIEAMSYVSGFIRSKIVERNDK